MYRLFFIVCNVCIKAKQRFSQMFWNWYHKIECQCCGVCFIDVRSVRFDGAHSIVIKPDAKVTIGKGFTSRSDRGHGIETTMTRILVGEGATLTVGDGTGISNTVLLCKNSLTIGNQVLIGGGLPYK